MCGSLLSKFKGKSNRIDPALEIFGEPGYVPSYMKLANQDSACFQDREIWREAAPNGESSAHSLAKIQSNSSLESSSQSDDYSSEDEIESAVRALAEQRVSYPTRNEKRRVENRHQKLMKTAHEILAFHADGASSSSYTVRTVQPLSSTNSTLPRRVPTPIAFDIPVEDKKTVCLSARVPMRFRQRKVAPECTLEDVKEKMRAAEERKLKELQRIRECARSRAGVSRPHPAEASAQATAEKIAAKQAAAESKRNAEIEKRKQAAGNKVSKNRNKIAAAQAFAKTQLQSSIKQKVDKTEQRKKKQQQKIDRQKTLREKHAKKVKDRVTRMRKEEEDGIRADLAELETYHASPDDGDESWGEEQEKRAVYEWEDFFTD